MTEERYISAADVAVRLGIKTRTLAKWRWLGIGPKGALQRSATVVVYPASEVDAYVDAMKARPRSRPFGPPGKGAAA